MENTTDFDLEELEARLYSQVFHSTENWDSVNVNEDLNSCNDQTRHVSLYSVNNTAKKGKRYWDEKNSVKDIDNNNKVTTPKQSITQQEPYLSTNNQSTGENNIQRNNHNTVTVLESIIPLENNVDQEYRTLPLKYKSFVIPPTLELPHSKVKRLPQYIIQFFKLNNKERKRKFRQFLRFLEKKHISTNVQNDFEEEFLKSNKQVDTMKQLENSTESKVTVDEADDQVFDLSMLPNPVNDSYLLKKQFENTEIITLSDSDSDSIIEVPLSPIPTYKVDSSSESEEDNDLEKTRILNAASLSSDKENSIDGASKQNDNIESKHFNDDSLEKRAQQDFENNKQRNKNDANTSFTELEKERDEFLHTPDSNNDFLEHDVSISKNNFKFNFGLHSSDLDLSKDKEEPFCKPSTATNDHDLYETESSCSEVGSVTRSRAVFNEINFESPIKDIFCEPDLSKFSNFITPNRNTQSKIQQSKKCSNTPFALIQTKACKKSTDKTKEKTEETKRRNRSESSEYHSDPTTLKISKKNKKAKKKTKKKSKQLGNESVSEICLHEKSDINSEIINKSPQEVVDKRSENKSIPSKSLSASKLIENLKFRARSKIDCNIANVSESNSCSSDILESDSINNQKQGRSVSDYYTDTYFADDCFMLEELENQQKNSELNSESNKEVYNSPCKLSNNVHFSFVETWKKSNKNCDSLENKTKNDLLPNKKIKTNNASTVHPYVVTILSDNEDSNEREITNTDNKKVKSTSRTIVTDKDYSDVIVNVDNDNMNLKSTSVPSLEHNKFSFLNTFLQNKEKKTFKDFWTFDMKKFYEDSWGQENFDLKKVQSFMSDNPSDWKIIPADLVHISSKRRGPPCFRCKEFGHNKNNCTKIFGPIKCTTCGYAGHTSSRCPNAVCTTCHNKSHYHTTSCGNCTHFNTILCNLCKYIGHETQNCPDLWRRYHLTTDSNTKLQTSSLVLKSSRHRWCCNCSKQGHYDDKCTYLRREHFPSTAGIISYVSTYDDVFKLPASPPAQIIPLFKNAKVTINDLRSLKNEVIISNNQKYTNILKQLKQQCQKFNIPLIENIDRLQRNMNNKEFSRKKISEIYRIRARIARQKFL